MELISQTSPHLSVFILIGFIAQIIDGTLGMAYGVSATSFLLTFGISPMIASASVHAAEVFTTGISGLSHLSFGNVNWYLAKRLIIPGMIGAVLGAFGLVRLPPGIIKPAVAAYLLVMGILIVSKALRHSEHVEVTTHLVPLGFVGGFLDAIGGGGWGPVVVSTLMVRGSSPRYTIGSVNLSEFFIALAASLTFVFTIGLSFWQAILGLAIGGALAAPLAAFLTKRAPTRLLMILVGAIIILLSIRTLALTLL